MLQLDASSKFIYKKFVPYFFTNAIKRLDFWQYIEPSRGQLPVTPYVLPYKTTTALALGKRYINQSRATRYRGLINIQLALSMVVAVASKKQTFLLCAIADGSRARVINIGTCRGMCLMSTGSANAVSSMSKNCRLGWLKGPGPPSLPMCGCHRQKTCGSAERDDGQFGVLRHAFRKRNPLERDSSTPLPIPIRLLTMRTTQGILSEPYTPLNNADQVRTFGSRQ